MAFVIYIENDMNIYLNGLVLEEDRSPLPDAELVAHIGIRTNPAARIANASNSSPIAITSAAHGLANGEQVIVSQVRGNVAANGLFDVANVTADTFELVDSVGDGDYSGGGVWYRAVEGATGIPLELFDGSDDTFLGRLERDNGIMANQQLAMIVECANYGLKFEIPGSAKVRS